jgi:hypothetical protein
VKKYVFLIFMLSTKSFSNPTLPSTVTFTTEEIINQKVSKVNQQNQMGGGPAATQNIFKSGQSSQGVNFASVAKTQQVGLDLNVEADQLRGDVTAQQVSDGVVDPQGCANSGLLTTYQQNMCLAADTLQSMAIETIEAQTEFKNVADRSYETMVDVSAEELSNSGAANFAADSHGLPTSTNILYAGNKASIDSFTRLFKSLEETNGYKGLKYNIKKDYFYLDGKKYPTSALMSRDAMIRAGIDKKLANFAFAALAKKSKLAQDKVMALLKSNKLYDGKNWSIVKMGNATDDATNLSSASPPDRDSLGNPQPLSSIDLSSSLVEEKTLFKEIDGIPLGLSSDDIFKIISRKYREKDKLGFFHNSHKK